MRAATMAPALPAGLLLALALGTTVGVVVRITHDNAGLVGMLLAAALLVGLAQQTIP